MNQSPVKRDELIHRVKASADDARRILKTIPASDDIRVTGLRDYIRYHEAAAEQLLRWPESEEFEWDQLWKLWALEPPILER